MPGTSESAPESGTSAPPPSPPYGAGTPLHTVPQSAPPGSTLRWNRILYVAVAVVVVVVVGVAALAVLHSKSPSTSGSDVLIPARSLTNLSAGQLAAVNFIVDSPSVLNGTYSTEFATTFWILTPVEYSTYLLHSDLPGYEWTNVTHGFVNLAYLQVTVPKGQWVFTMLNTNLTQTSGVGWITALTLTPG
jgi:hypothetical protein